MTLKINIRTKVFSAVKPKSVLNQNLNFRLKVFKSVLFSSDGIIDDWANFRRLAKCANSR